MPKGIRETIFSRRALFSLSILAVTFCSIISSQGAAGPDIIAQGERNFSLDMRIFT